MDSVTLEIIWGRLVALVDEAAVALRRMAFSTLARESNDYCCVVLDRRGRMVAQNTRAIPIFVGSIGVTARAMLERVPIDMLRPGDVLVTNDPWIATGHLNDFTVVTPIFHGGRVIGLAGSVAHASDIGGRLWSADAREMFEEGLRIPITFLFREDTPNQQLFDIIRANVRVPDEVTGDLEAMVLANQVVGRGLARLAADYDLPDLDAVFDEVIARSEQAMRQSIRDLSPGTYQHAIRLDGFESEIVLAAAVTIEDGGITVDYGGSSPQSERGINVVPNYTFAYTAYGLKCALTPLIPNNEGSYRPIRVIAPEGSILNPRFPAAVGSRGRTGHFVVFAVLGALAQALPRGVPADAGTATFLFFGGSNLRGRQFTNLLPMNGGLGARPEKDGIACLAFPANCSAVPIEIVETLTPIRVRRKEILTDSGGPGRFRGGCGVVIDLEIAREMPAPDVTVSLMTERTRHPAGGTAGGQPGTPMVCVLNDNVGLHPKQQIVAHRGDRLTFRTPGGGGVGNPLEREPQRVARDVRLGLVSREAAERDYAVVLTGAGGVDEPATSALRASRRTAAGVSGRS